MRSHRSLSQPTSPVSAPPPPRSPVSQSDAPHAHHDSCEVKHKFHNWNQRFKAAFRAHFPHRRRDRRHSHDEHDRHSLPSRSSLSDDDRQQQQQQQQHHYPHALPPPPHRDANEPSNSNSHSSMDDTSPPLLTRHGNSTSLHHLGHDVETAGVALHDCDGRIVLDIADEDKLDLAALHAPASSNDLLAFLRNEARQKPLPLTNSRNVIAEDADDADDDDDVVDKTTHAPSDAATVASPTAEANKPTPLVTTPSMSSIGSDTSSNAAALLSNPPPRQQDPPRMNICIMVVGTRGDVQPFLAIAKRLQQDGHRVRLATHATYRDLVVTEHGVEFYPLGGDPKELAAYMVKTGGHLIPLKLETIQKDVPRNMQMIEEILHTTWPAVSAADPDGGGVGVAGMPFQAHAIISNPVTYGHIHVAERLGVPLHIMFPQPWVPTVAFPHPLSNLPYNNKPSKKNYLSYKLVDLLMWQGTETMVNEFRTEVLGLRKIRKGDGGRDLLIDLAIPHAFMWSAALVRKPADWDAIYDVVGTVTLQKEGGGVTDYDPSPELEAFLTADASGPIYVGFGSMVIDEPKKTTTMIIEAARLANARVLIQSSWSDMADGIDVPDNIFFLGNCPHDWLMPRVSAVVHHGGAGTTAAGLLAGKPTFIVPFFGDQPFWGRAVVNANVGVEPCPIHELTIEKLRTAFEELLSPELQANAHKIRDVMLIEDGVGRAVDAFYRNLPIDAMVCDLDHDRMATQWRVSDRLKLCDACAYVVGARPENFGKRVVPYQSVDYSARGPSSGFEGASSGAGAFFHELSGAVKDVVVKPARGYREEGAKGAVIGVVKGLSGLLIRPIHGVALFADHIATGHVNFFRDSGTHKRGSVFEHQIMSAIGLENALSGTYAANMHPDDAERRSVVDEDATTLSSATDEQQRQRHQRRRIELQLSDEDKQRYQQHFYELVRIKQQQQDEWVRHSLGSDTSTASEHTEVDSNTLIDGLDATANDNSTTTTTPTSSAENVPPMTICLATPRGWSQNLKQFVALGLRLQRDGHRVRVAAHERHRHHVTDRGLEFFPLGGSESTLQELIQYVHDAHTKTKRPTRLLRRHRTKRHVLADVRALMFSVWGAAVRADPHGSGIDALGEQFRADALICDPMLFGHVDVAERLGIPLHCLSLEPLTPTRAFPHVLSAYFSDLLTDGNSTMTTANADAIEWNWRSYSAVDTLIHDAIVDVQRDFRSFIGIADDRSCHDRLANASNTLSASPLVDYAIPHTYCWHAAALAAPPDWPSSSITIAGWFTVDDALEQRHVQSHVVFRSFNDFCLETQLPLLFVGIASHWTTLYSHLHSDHHKTKDDDDALRALIAKIDDAAQQAGVRVLLQRLRSTDDDDDDEESDEDDSDEKEDARDHHAPPVARITRRLHRSSAASFSYYHSDQIYEVPQDFCFTAALRKVAGVLIYGDSSDNAAALFAAALAAGKPVSMCPLAARSNDVFAASARVHAGVDVPPPLDISTCSSAELAAQLQALPRPEVQVRAQALVNTIPSDATALETAVAFFYSNLPLPAMVCDLDPHKLARVYDAEYDLKLSFDAYFAIRSLRQHDGARDVPYRPLHYDSNRRKHKSQSNRSSTSKSKTTDEEAVDELHGAPPTYSLRGIRGAMRHATQVTAPTRRVCDALCNTCASKRSSPSTLNDAASGATTTATAVLPDGSTGAAATAVLPSLIPTSLLRTASLLPIVEARPVFWATEAEEVAARNAIHAAYEQALALRTSNSNGETRGCGGRSPSSSSSNSNRSKRRLRNASDDTGLRNSMDNDSDARAARLHVAMASTRVL